MIIIVSTPLRILASYAVAFAAGAVLSRHWRVRRTPVRTNPAEAMPGH